jgi:phthalate 4,5-dioxygenase oxygenase subunit
VASVIVPIDDTGTMFYFLAWTAGDKPGIEQEAWRKFNVAQPGIDLDSQFRNLRTIGIVAAR